MKEWRLVMQKSTSARIKRGKRGQIANVECLVLLRGISGNSAVVFLEEKEY